MASVSEDKSINNMDSKKPTDKNTRKVKGVHELRTLKH